MQLILTGVHQRTTPLTVRERLSFDDTTLPDVLHELRSYVAEAFVISTCNRTEICALMADGADSIATLHQFLARSGAISPESLAPHLYTHTGADVVRHLFRLAAGLDSMVLGEDQIMGQIKDAHTIARDAGTLGKTIHRLVSRALAAGKRVRTQTRIASHHVSVVSVALDLARGQMKSLADQRIAIVGAGHIAELVLKHLKDDATADIVLLNRGTQSGTALAARYGVRFRPWDAMASVIAASDIVISCTTAPSVLIDVPLVAATLTAGIPKLFIDLAVPRDIAPAVADLPGVTLFDVDAIQEICDANRAARVAEIAHAETLITAEVDAYMDWWMTQQIVPTIQALRDRAEVIRSVELQRTLARLPDLSPQAQEAIHALSAAIVNKLLHEPIVTLKDPALGGDLASAVRLLFHLVESERESHVIEQ